MATFRLPSSPVLLPLLAAPVLLVATACGGGSSSSVSARITAISPTSGGLGTSVTITGTGLANARRVAFGAGAATGFTATATQIVATVPAGASTGPVSVVTQSGQTLAGPVFTVVGAAITDVQPRLATPGSNVTILGSGLGNAQSVAFGGVAGTIVSSQDGQLVATVPAGAISGPVTVVTFANQTLTGPDFTVQLTQPGISRIDPIFGLANTTVTLYGLGLLNAQSVAFGGVQGTLVDATQDTQITVTVPQGAVSGAVTVVTAGGQTLTGPGFLVSASASAITGINPASGGPGITVTLTGAGLRGATDVQFNGFQATSFDSSRDDQITAVVPPNATTGPVTVVDAAGRVIPQQPTFAFVPVPTVQNIFPTIGVPGSLVTFTGTFLPATGNRVFFDNVEATAWVSAADPTRLNAVVPDGLTAATASVRVNLGGSDMDMGYFQVAPSRLDFLNVDLSAAPDRDFVAGLSAAERSIWDAPQGPAPGSRRAGMYHFLELPQAPIFHPYNVGVNRRNDAAGHPIPETAFTVSLNFKLPPTFLDTLPPALLDQIKALQPAGLNPNQVDIFVESQNQIWNVTAATPAGADSMVFRPNYWLANSPEYDATYVQGFPAAQVGLYDTPAGVAFQNGGTFFPVASFNNHIDQTVIPGLYGGSLTPVQPVIASGNEPRIVGLDFNQSSAFWTLVVDGNRAAATLHLLLNDADQGLLEAALNNAYAAAFGAPEVRHLIQQLNTPAAAAAVTNPAILTKLGRLTRPVVTYATLDTTTPGANATLTLRGTGFEGAYAVVLGAADGTLPATPPALPDFDQNESKITVTVPVDAVTAGTIVVQSAVGEDSDPVTLTR